MNRGGRSLAAALAMAATLAQLIALSHEAGVRHVRCAEHGELTHVAPASARGPILSFVPRGVALERGALDLPATHEHCAAAFTAQSGAAPRMARGGLRLPAPAALRVAGPSPTFWRETRSILASAPKTSPPRSLHA